MINSFLECIHGLGLEGGFGEAVLVRDTMCREEVLMLMFMAIGDLQLLCVTFCCTCERLGEFFTQEVVFQAICK